MPFVARNQEPSWHILDLLGEFMIRIFGVQPDNWKSKKELSNVNHCWLHQVQTRRINIVVVTVHSLELRKSNIVNK